MSKYKDKFKEWKMVDASPDVFDTDQAAAYLTISPSTLEKDRMSGSLGVPYFKLGSLVRYHRGDLDAYLCSRPQITPGKVEK